MGIKIWDIYIDNYKMTEKIDYSKCVIYKIVCKDKNVKDNYVGHTTNFIKRKSNHKDATKTPTDKHYSYKLYQTIRQNGGWNNWDMIKIEDYNCKTKEEACERELYYYNILKPNLNMKKPLLTNYEKEKKQKVYNDKIKDIVFHCECGVTYKGSNHIHRHERTLRHQKYFERLNDIKPIYL